MKEYIDFCFLRLDTFMIFSFIIKNVFLKHLSHNKFFLKKIFSNFNFHAFLEESLKTCFFVSDLDLCIYISVYILQKEVEST